MLHDLATCGFDHVDRTKFAKGQSETCFRNAHFSERHTIQNWNMPAWNMFQNSTQHATLKAGCVWYHMICCMPSLEMRKPSQPVINKIDDLFNFQLSCSFTLLKTLSLYLVDLALLSNSMTSFYPSETAASALRLALYVLCPEMPDVWDMTMTHYSNYTERQLSACITSFAELVAKGARSRCQVFFFLLKIAFLCMIFLYLI